MYWSLIVFKRINNDLNYLKQILVNKISVKGEKYGIKGIILEQILVIINY